ncbi:hypothetical protein B0A48_01243 [Cryoendolithus antarcticus]|uniref:WW domain-containing protein n=1 Tax=Cryoendolithus antarcticus TaxID=1507870 RepID=A0A1V8TSR7_9PEZI|nr:hypothetical protein B0A48_01243 [Cryoendolithus antarcticus]
MSFLKNLSKGFDELKAKSADDDHAKTGHAPEAKRGESCAYYGSQQPQSGPAPGLSHAGGDQRQGYGNHLPPQGSLPGAPTCPPGWSSQWNQNQQRWFFTKQATGHSSWNPPNPGHGDNRGFMGYIIAPQYGAQAPQHSLGGHDNPSYGAGHAPHSGGPQYGQPGHGHEKKGGNNAMLYGAGGLAAGAVGGALITNAMDDDDHHGGPAQGPSQGYGGDPSYVQGGYGAPPSGAPPEVLPATDADGESVSSSDREEVQDARADYEEAVAEASEGSSSDAEEVAEAREDYEEAYEETYED